MASERQRVKARIEYNARLEKEGRSVHDPIPVRPKYRTDISQVYHVDCPKCHFFAWYEGPEGSSSQMLKCATCGAEYTYGVFGLEEIKEEHGTAER